MGLPAIAEIITRGSGWGSASERSAKEPVVPRVMRGAEAAYITLRIQTSVTQELVDLLAVAAVRAVAWRPLPFRRIAVRLVPRDGRDLGRKPGYTVALDLQRPVRVDCQMSAGKWQEQRQV